MLPKGLLKEYSKAVSLLMRLLDAGTILFASWVAYIWKFHTIQFIPPYLAAVLIGIVFWSIVFSSLNVYASLRSESFFNHIFKIFEAIMCLGFLLAGLSFFTKTGDLYSRAWFVAWMGLSLIFLVLIRCSILLLLRLMRKRGLNERRVIIFGAGNLGTKFAATVQQALWTGYRIVAFMDDNVAQKPNRISDISVLQTPNDLPEYLNKSGIDELWLALPLRAESRVKEIMYELRNHPVTLRFVLDIFSIDLLNHSITELAGYPVLNIRSTPMVGINRAIKALEDRVMAGIILLVISPLLLFLAILVKLTSKGPIFFKQERLGWDGKIIWVYKFRTMFEHTEKAGAVTQAKLNDSRVTKVGQFLRKTSLDELPQFFNVLQGTMSIVGPRPHALAHNELYKDMIHSYMQRHRVKPGITGWAQVNGWRGETDTLAKMEKRIEYDLYYIKHWSLAFDIKIIVLTICRGFINKNAY